MPATNPAIKEMDKKGQNEVILKSEEGSLQKISVQEKF